MNQTWEDLTSLTRGKEIRIERVRLVDSEMVIEGRFEVPPLARLSAEDQAFVTAFVRSHGSIKSMEELFGVSYPTVKNRLNRIAGQLEFVEVRPVSPSSEILNRLEAGEISAREAAAELRRTRGVEKGVETDVE